jgi:hypothetical protein
MRSLSKNLAIALAALFVAWLVTGPTFAVAGDVPAREAAKTPEFIGFAQDYGGGAENGFSKFSLKLYGGYSHIMATDINDGSAFYFDLIEAYAAEGFGTFTGGYKPVHGGYNFGADLIYQITPALGIGLGVGYMRNASDSLATWSEGEESVDILGDATITAMPIRLGLFLTVPLGDKFNLTADAGAAYYLGLKLNASQGLEWAADDWMRMTLEASERSGLDIGFHGALGFEYRISPKLGFFVEAVGRYAKFKNFEMVTGLSEYSDGSSDTTEGRLYIGDETLGDYEVSMFTIVEEGDIPDPDWREPKIDLTGFSLQAGFRIRF